MRGLVLLTLFAIGPTTLAAAQPEGTHVRGGDKRVVAALVEGKLRSAHFRDVVERVERGDVIAYIEMQPLLRGKLAGTTTWVTATKDFRYVRVALNPELTGWNLVATLAHELQHVAEIAEAPWIVDANSLSAHYRHVGIEQRRRIDRWDTEAAQILGEIVRRELAQTPNERSEPIAPSVALASSSQD